MIYEEREDARGPEDHEQAWRPAVRQEPLRRHWPGALVVEHLADAGLLLGRQLGVVDREVGAGRHALLHRGPGAQLLEPALEVLELLDVLALELPVDGPRIADHVGDRV